MSAGQLAPVPVLQSPSVKDQDDCLQTASAEYINAVQMMKLYTSVEDKVGTQTDARGCLDTDHHVGGMGQQEKT